MDALRIERDDDVLRVTLARPELRNAFDATLIEELAEAFVDVGKSRAVVLAGDGPSFCAGADIEWMRRSARLSHDENVADANALRRMFDAIDACPAPVIAVVHGHALGGGAGLVATADIAIAHERTVFAFSEVKLGIIPAVDLSVRAEEDRRERSPPILRDRRAVRRAHGDEDRACPRGNRQAG